MPRLQSRFRRTSLAPSLLKQGVPTSLLGLEGKSVKYLKRSDVRQEMDRATRSVTVRYVGPRVDFGYYLYGYPEGTIFAAELDDIPWPDSLADLADAHGVMVDALPDAPRLRTAVADSLAAEAIVNAPQHLREMDVDRDFSWRDLDLRHFERRHQIAVARVAEIARLMEADLRLRVSRFKTPSFEAPPIEAFMVPLPPRERRPEERLSAPALATPEPEERLVEPAPPAAHSEPPTGDYEPVEEGDLDGEEIDEDVSASKVVVKVTSAVVAARESELPQRLPGGARRRLRRMPPGAYIAHGEHLDARLDLCGALTDGRAMGRKGREVTVIDWDGEWPVVARRFGADGRTIYRVESALRRYGVSLS